MVMKRKLYKKYKKFKIRKNDKYLTDYLADIFIWISKTTIVHTIWSIIVFFKTMIRLVIWGQKYMSR